MMQKFNILYVGILQGVQKGATEETAARAIRTEEVNIIGAFYPTRARSGRRVVYGFVHIPLWWD